MPRRRKAAPTASLEWPYQHQTLTGARRFSARNVAVLVILHDLNLAAQYADRILLLDRGRQVAVGAPHEVLGAGGSSTMGRDR